MADGAIGWWEIDVPDIGKATAFYSATTTWELAPMEGYAGYVIVNAGGVGIGALVASQEADPTGRGTRLYIEVSDLEDTLSRVRQAGGSVEQERMPVPGDQWVATARDPFANRIGFVTNNAAK
jgi:uncharacterized protein